MQRCANGDFDSRTGFESPFQVTIEDSSSVQQQVMSVAGSLHVQFIFAAINDRRYPRPLRANFNIHLRPGNDCLKLHNQSRRLVLANALLTSAARPDIFHLLPFEVSRRWVWAATFR